MQENGREMLQNGKTLVAINLNESLGSEQKIDIQKEKEREMGQNRQTATNDDHNIPDAVHNTHQQTNSSLVNTMLHTNQKQIELQATNSILNKPNQKDEEKSKNVNLIAIQNEAPHKIEDDSSVGVRKSVEKFT